MKKIILAVLLLSSVSYASAQVNFGIKAGYHSSLSFDNMSTISTGEYNLNAVKNEIWNNFHVGFFGRIGFGKIYFQPELLYAIQKKDYKVTLKDAVTQDDVTVDKFANISTVDVPLLLGVKLIDLKIINLRAFVGPKLRFNAGSTLDFNNIKGGNFSLTDLSSDIKKAQLGLEIGAGMDVLMLALDFRYNLIGNMYETKLKDISLKNLPASTFVISLGWKLF